MTGVKRTSLDYMTVVERHPDKRAIDTELRKLDERLFLDTEHDPDFDCLVWSVKFHLGVGQPPLLISDWRDPETRRPLELSWGLWSRIKSRENRDPFKLRDEIKAENERQHTLRAERTMEAYEEISRDMVPRMSETRSAVLPRSQALRRSRDRLRSLGHKV